MPWEPKESFQAVAECCGGQESAIRELAPPVGRPPPLLDRMPGAAPAAFAGVAAVPVETEPLRDDRRSTWRAVAGSTAADQATNGS